MVWVRVKTRKAVLHRQTMSTGPKVQNKGKAIKTETPNHKKNAATERGAQRLNTHGKES